MRLRIMPDMAFYLDMELQGVGEMTREEDIQEYQNVVYDEFVSRLKKAFPQEDFRIYRFDFTVARDSGKKAA